MKWCIFLFITFICKSQSRFLHRDNCTNQPTETFFQDCIFECIEMFYIRKYCPVCKFDIDFSINNNENDYVLVEKKRNISIGIVFGYGTDTLFIGAKWESIAGYSRAIRVGNVIEVAGTVAVNEANELVGKDDIYLQTTYILQKIQKVLQEAGADVKDVVRTRMFTTDISKFDDISRAHGEMFRDIRPVCTLIEVSRLIQPDLLIEIEASAIVT